MFVLGNVLKTVSFSDNLVNVLTPWNISNPHSRDKPDVGWCLEM